MKENFTNAQSDPLVEAAAKILSGQIEEAYGESWVVYNKDTKAKISKSFKTRKAAYDYASKNGGVVYSAEYYFDNKDEIHSGKLVKEDFSEETINENKKVTSEKSQFGGFRPKIINGDGSVFFLGSQAFKTSQGAEKAAQYYLDQYEKGVNTKNIKMMKGDYVKESDSLTELAMKFAIVDTTDGTVVATASDEKSAKRIISSAHLPPLSIKDSSKLEIVKTKKTAEVGYPLQEMFKESNTILISALKKKGFKRLMMADLDAAIRKAKVNTPLGDVVDAYEKENEGKIVLFYDDGTASVVYKGKVIPQTHLKDELQEVTKGKLVDILKKTGWESMGMKDLDDAIRKAKVNTPLGDVIGAWSKADKIVLFYDDGTSDFVSLRDRKITSTKDLWFGNPSKLTEALKTPTYPLVRKVMNVAEDLDADELEEFFFTLSNYMIYGGFGAGLINDEVGAHLLRAAKTWKNRYNK